MATKKAVKKVVKPAVKRGRPKKRAPFYGILFLENNALDTLQSMTVLMNGGPDIALQALKAMMAITRQVQLAREGSKESEAWLNNFWRDEKKGLSMPGRDKDEEMARG